MSKKSAVSFHPQDKSSGSHSTQLIVTVISLKDTIDWKATLLYYLPQSGFMSVAEWWAEALKRHKGEPKYLVVIRRVKENV